MNKKNEKLKRRINKVVRVLMVLLDIIMIVTLILILMLYGSFWVFPELYGTDEYLGNKLYRDGYGREGIIILAEKMEGNVVLTGTQIIPDYEEVTGKSYPYGNNVSMDCYSETVIEQEADRHWIIVRTLQISYPDSVYSYGYYIMTKDFNPDTIVDKRSIYKRYVYKATDSIDFISKCKQHGINLKLGDAPIANYVSYIKSKKFKQNIP